MQQGGIAKVQHYVPKFLLRNFGIGKKDQIYVFDKQKLKAFPSNVKNIASESRFYDFQNGADTYSLEPTLSKLESNATPIVNRLLKCELLSCVSTDDRELLSLFIAVQFTRTKAFREMYRNIPLDIHRKLKVNVSDEEHLKGLQDYFISPDENELKQCAADFIIENSVEFSEVINSKLWFLMKANGAYPFVIGDNPVVLNNSLLKAHPFYGTLGLAVKGIEIYCPLSPTLSLMMLCKSYRETGFGKVLDSGNPLQCSMENVKHHNSLQIVSAERYVMSSKYDFELAQRMLNRNAKIVTGPRMKIW